MAWAWAWGGSDTRDLSTLLYKENCPEIVLWQFVISHFPTEFREAKADHNIAR